MEWSEVVEHPSLRNLPFKIETNRYEQIVMSPASNQQGLFQSAISSLIFQLKTSGYLQTECAVTTDEGVKVADVAWYSVEFRNVHRGEIAYVTAPELCVEILSPSNSCYCFATVLRCQTVFSRPVLPLHCLLKFAAKVNDSR